MNDKHIKQSPMLTLPGYGGGSNSPLVRKRSTGFDCSGDGVQDPHPGSWTYDIETLGFMGKSPNYKWRAQTTSNSAGVFLKPDGYAFYILSQDGILRRHNMTTAYDLGTAYYTQKLSLSLSSATNGRGVVFKADGTQFFYLDNNIIKSYTLSTAWDLYTASYNSSNTLNVSSNLVNSSNSVSVNFKPDGSRVYVAESNGSTDNYIHQWTLSSTWNLTTASYAQKSPVFENTSSPNVYFADRIRGFAFKTDGTVLYVTHNNNMRIGIWPLSTAWDVTTRGARTGYPVYYQVVESFDCNGSNVQFKSDGTVYYVLFGQSSNLLSQFEPSSAWNLSSNGARADSPGDESDYEDYVATYAQGSYYMGGVYTGMFWVNNGNTLISVGQGDLYIFTCSTPYEWKTASFSYSHSLGSSMGYGLIDFKMNAAGTRYLVANVGNKIVKQIDCSTAFDLRSSNVTSTSDLDLTAGGGPSSPRGAFISHNGEHIYAMSTDTIYQWDLACPFNVSTATYNQSKTLPVIGSYRNPFKMSPNGTRLYIMTNQYPTDGHLYEFNLTTAFDVSTIGTSSGSYKNRSYNDLSPYGPPLVQSVGANITTEGLMYAPYYKYFAMRFRQCDFVSSGLIHHLDAGNSSSYSGSGTTWTDLSSSSNNGTLTNGPTYSTSAGGSIDFDGGNDSVRTSSEMFNPNANFTFSAWVYADSVSTTHTVVSDRNNAGSFQLRISGGSWQIVDSYVVDVGTFNNSSPIATDYWYNITVSRSSNTYSLYVNGRIVSSFTSSNSYDRGPKDIGTNYTTTELWNGKISQVMSYNRALSETEILQNFNHFKHRYSN